MINDKKEIDTILIILVMFTVCIAIFQTVNLNNSKNTISGSYFYINGKGMHNNPVTLTNTSSLCQTTPCSGGW